jgi:hypothetical protein
MGGKTTGYIIGGIEIVVGVLAEIFSLGILSEAAIPLIIAGVGTIIGTALSPTPPRPKDRLRDSPTYGIDQFENPRGPEAFVPILYGEHLVKPVVISESVSSIAENNAPGVDAQTKQAVKWLGVVCEGEVEAITDVTINDIAALSDPNVGVRLGNGNGSKKEFAFSHSWVYLGDEENPAVDVFVGGVQVAWRKRSAAVEFTVPSAAYLATFDVVKDQKGRTWELVRDNRSERILEGSIRVYLRGPGHPQVEQLRHAGVFRWSAQKHHPWMVRLRLHTRPPEGFTIRVTYDYFGTDGLAIVQDSRGRTKAVFAAPPANGTFVTATYRTTPFHGLKIRWRPGTLDQSPIDGFTDLEQSRNPREQVLAKDTPLTYSTDGRAVDDLRIGLIAPRGFIHYATDGGSDPVGVHIGIDYRKLGASTWTALRNESGARFHLVGQKTSAIRWEIGIRDELDRLILAGDKAAQAELEVFDRGPYEVRVTLFSGVSTDPLIANELNFSHVTEVTREGFSYPGTCLLALSAMPSAALTGQALRVSCRARRARLYDPREAGGSRDVGSSQNAALAIRDLVTSAEGAAVERYGAGSFFGAADFFGATNIAPLNGFSAFADFCDAWVLRPGDDATRAASATNGERRCRLNVVLDTPQSLMETVGDLAFLGCCFASLQGARWRFPLDQDGDPVFTFVDDVDPVNQNMSKFVLRLEEWGKSPSGIQGSFWNEAIDFERDELLYPVDGLPEAVPLNIREVDLRGCTRESEAARILRHLAEQARALPFPCTWEAHPGVQHVEAGDVVTVKTRVPYSTGAKATELKVRILAGAVGRDEEGKLTVRYAGRVMRSSVYALSAVTVPVSAAQTSTGKSSRAATRGRVVTNLRARVG